MNLILANSEFFTVKDFLYTFLSATGGVAAGLLWTEWRTLAKDSRHRKEELKLLRHELEEQKKLVARAFAQYQAPLVLPGIPGFTLDVAGLIRRIDGVMGFISPAMLNELDCLRYQMEHASLEMVKIYQISTAINSQAATEHPSYDPISVHLRQIDSRMEKLLTDLVNEETNQPATRPFRLP